MNPEELLVSSDPTVLPLFVRIGEMSANISSVRDGHPGDERTMITRPSTSASNPNKCVVPCHRSMADEETV